ncbi:hypothetical protein C8035_v006095 [Colletotrichum spinosum]|uniref:Secreted in xylem 5 n=1 Tax=Colletotrichum spinosum TaxID=1347390 RepID=A0A4R8Q436_9PEZI|nr:hypothetical protein C8035_v006095 [Colletotrichum spinosum]
MKFSIATVMLASTALASSHFECACQQSTGSSVFVDAATKACCPSDATSNHFYDDGTKGSSTIRFTGYYCLTASDELDGNNFYDCCRKNGAGDSTCN